VDEKGYSSPRARLVVAVMLMAVSAVILLANLPSEPLTVEFMGEVINGKSPDRGAGWPRTWYWRSPKQVPGRMGRLGSAVVSPSGIVPLKWSVSRCSASYLALDSAAWLAILAASGIGCDWATKRCRWWPKRRPRAGTLLVVALVCTLIVLANLSSEAEAGGQRLDYGWPVIWYWHITSSFYAESDFGAGALIANYAVWLAMGCGTATGCEWLFGRYRPVLRWSLRTMMVATALAGALCALCAATRNRADEQDAAIDALGGDRHVYFERAGPNWLDVVGADRFRRSVVGAYVDQERATDDVFQRLARLRSLRFLDISPYLYEEPFCFSASMAAALADMRQLHMLNVNCRGNNLRESRHAARECLAAIGKLTQLERLHLKIWETNCRDLASLGGLSKLKTLSLDILPFPDWQDADVDEPDSDGQLGWPAHGEPVDHGPEVGDNDAVGPIVANLKVLPRLEELQLRAWQVGDEDVGRICSFTALKSLDLRWTSVTCAGLSELAPLESLQELAIRQRAATAAGFAALAKLKSLSAVHIYGSVSRRRGSMNAEQRSYPATRAAAASIHSGASDPAKLALDDASELQLPAGELQATRSALESLRRSHPRIVIDADYAEFHQRSSLEAPWHLSDQAELNSFMHRWLNEP
jgi:hypothetical protein